MGHQIEGEKDEEQRREDEGRWLGAGREGGVGRASHRPLTAHTALANQSGASFSKRSFFAKVFTSSRHGGPFGMVEERLE